MAAPISAPYVVWLTAKAGAALLKEAKGKYPNETGGVLIGYEGDAGTGSVITEIIGPGPGAKHSKVWFEPDVSFHEAAVARAYARSGKRHTYLGDWHTHPDGSNLLSWRDRRTLRKIAKEQAPRLQRALMAILALNEEADALAVHAAAYTGPKMFRRVRIDAADLRLLDR